MLKDNALEIVRSFPTEIQKGNLKHLIVAFKDHFRRDERIETLKFIDKLRNLFLQRTNLTRYCELVEELSAKAYPSMSKDNLSFVRAEHLYRNIVDGTIRFRVIDYG